MKSHQAPSIVSALTDAVLIAKDKVHAQHKEAGAHFFDLYERIGRLVPLYLEDVDRARREMLELCDIEYALTGDTKGTQALADVLDPEGDFFRLMREPKFVVGDLEGEYDADDIKGITDELRTRLMALEIGGQIHIEPLGVEPLGMITRVK